MQCFMAVDAQKGAVDETVQNVECVSDIKRTEVMRAQVFGTNKTTRCKRLDLKRGCVAGAMLGLYRLRVYDGNISLSPYAPRRSPAAPNDGAVFPPKHNIGSHCESMAMRFHDED